MKKSFLGKCKTEELENSWKILGKFLGKILEKILTGWENSGGIKEKPQRFFFGTSHFRVGAFLNHPVPICEDLFGLSITIPNGHRLFGQSGGGEEGVLSVC